MSQHGTVLLVDDEPHVLAALRRCLLGDGLRILVAERPDQAREILEREDVDLVLSDFDMPGEDGLTFLRSVGELRPDALRVMLSGRADLQVAFEAVNDGLAYRFLTKPWEEVEVRLLIRRALEHRTDRLRVRELSLLVERQAAVFAQILARHPDCRELLESVLESQEAELASPVGASVG
ncbi:MAG: response regulator [Acidobacteriota bacterium]